MHGLLVCGAILVILIAFFSIWEHINVRRTVRESTYNHNHEKYMRAFHERRQHEEKYGEDNLATAPELQKLLRIEIGALHFLRSYHPRESDHLEVRLRALLRRLDDSVIC